jgi:glycosyltransferase involved in cell wall biosynthesis
MTTNKERLSAVIITFNEIGYIEKCIASIDFADEIIVVDSYSTDGTYEYLLEHPKVRVLQRPFDNFTSQKSFALKQATHDWVLFLDADEVVPHPLQKEIVSTINNASAVEAYWFYRSFMYQNQRLRFSGWQTDKNHRLFKKSKVKFTDAKLVHETLEVNGTSGILNEKLIHFCYKDYGDYKAKMLHYGRLKALESYYKEKRFFYCLLLLKPFWKFVNHYFIRLGFLDGAKGVNVCYLNALSVYERYRELQQLEKKNALAYYLVMP